MRNIVRSKIKKRTNHSIKNIPDFFRGNLEWEKNHVSHLPDKDHALKLDVQTVTRLSQSKPINFMI